MFCKMFWKEEKCSPYTASASIYQSKTEFKLLKLLKLKLFKTKINKNIFLIFETDFMQIYQQLTAFLWLKVLRVPLWAGHATL